MFYDFSKINIKAGDGGNGIVAFRREKYVPRGGPAGGDGGRGGHIVLVGDEGLTTLVDFKYKKHYKAGRGSHGGGKNMFGAGGEDLYLQIPLGTLIRDAESGEILADIISPGQEVVAAKGGRGGRGNASFATAKDKAPRFSEKGEPGQERWLTLELKLLADVGLIGLPNAGKSTLISRISAARPKIADYPFTTITPNLGVVDLGDGNSFVVADLPGLIAGAAAGAGLGHRFLRHVERTKVLVHLLDLSGLTAGDPAENFALVNQELVLYRRRLSERPQIIAASKMDSPEAAEKLAQLQDKLGEKEEIWPISALTGEGIKPLLGRIWKILEEERAKPPTAEEEEVKLTRVRREEPWQIQRLEQNLWQVTGEEVEKLVAMTDLKNEDAVARMQRKFMAMGLDGALKTLGIQEGDSIRIGREEFEYAE